MTQEILSELAKPFHPSHVTWKPGVVKGDRALALAYADIRAYQNRLDEVCGLDWSVSYTPWGDRLVCHVTIAGVTRSSTGEADARSEKSEIAGTAAEAQAFKRACSMFGLGRYLYSLPSAWADYDGQRKQFTEAGKAKLDNILAQHYRRHVDPQASSRPPAADSSAGVQTETEPELARRRKRLHALGMELYADKWEGVRHANVERLTAGRTSSSNDLTLMEVNRLIAGLEKLQRTREPDQATG